MTSSTVEKLVGFGHCCEYVLFLPAWTSLFLLVIVFQFSFEEHPFSIFGPCGLNGPAPPLNSRDEHWDPGLTNHHSDWFSDGHFYSHWPTWLLPCHLALESELVLNMGFAPDQGEYLPFYIGWTEETSLVKWYLNRDLPEGRKPALTILGGRMFQVEQV